MTHTLHRVGTPENLANDFNVIFRPEKGVSSEGSAPKMKKAIEMLVQNEAANFGDVLRGSAINLDAQIILDNIKNGEAIYVSFSDREKLLRFLKDTVEADLGLSVVVQGPFDAVAECLRGCGLKIHTVNSSLGIWGRTDKLPSAEVQQITSMCGHGMIAASLVVDVIEKIKEGKLTCKDGAKLLSTPCVCGIYNPDRAERLLEEYTNPSILTKTQTS